MSPHTSVAMFEQWKVLEYLEAPEIQDVALWPTVLGVCCKTYSDMVSTTMTFTALANSDDMLARLKDVAPDSTSGLSIEDRRKLEKKLIKLLAYARVRKTEYESCNKRMLSALKGLDVFAGTGEGTGAPGSIMRRTLPAKANYAAPLERVNSWPPTTSGHPDGDRAQGSPWTRPIYGSTSRSASPLSPTRQS